MSKNIVYIGTSGVREITAAQWTAIGIVGEPTRRWEKANSFEQLVSDTAAVYLLAQGEFVDESGLSFPAVVNDSYNNKRFEQRMKTAPVGSYGDWRSWNSKLARRSAERVDVLWTGDSIGEGWCCNAGPAPQTTTHPNGDRDKQGMLGVARRLVQLMFNKEGRGGQWVPAGGGWWGQSPWKFSANGSDTEVNDGISLRGREMSVSNANPATITVPMCDGMTLLYEKINVFGACDLRVSVDGSQVTQLATYDGTLAAFATEVYQYQWTGTRGPHTFSLAAVANGGFNTLCRFTGAFFHDGDMSSGVCVWNGSHFGYTLSNYLAAGTSYTSSIRKGFIKPRLHIIALGTNDTTDSTYLTNLLAQIDAVNAACVVAGEPRPALAILTPPPNASDTASLVEQNIRTAAYTAAAARNGEVWEWNELEGDVSIAGGDDPFAQTYNISSVKDNTHPGGAGHRMIGEYVANKIITNSAPTVAVDVLSRKVDSGRRDVKVVTASGTAQTLDASEYKFFNVTLTGNCTVTLSGAVAGLRSTVEITFKQDGTGSRTVTFSPLVKWASGTAFTASTAASAIDKIKLDTDDGGTTWVGTFTKGHA